MNSRHGCPVFGLTALWRWVAENRYFVGCVLLLLGALLCEFGGKHYLASMFTISTFAMMITIVTLLFSFIMPSSTPQYMVWIIMAASLIVGLGLGYGAYHWPKLGIIVISIFAGAVFGTVMYTVFFGDINDKKENELQMTINERIDSSLLIQAEETSQLLQCIAVFSCLFCGISLVFFDYAVIYSSCFVGAYLGVRGLSELIGGFPNEFLIYESLVNNKFTQQQSTLFLYVIAMLLISVFTIQRQLRKRTENLEMYSYKKFDFRYRRLAKDANGNAEGNLFGGLPGYEAMEPSLDLDEVE